MSEPQITGLILAGGRGRRMASAHGIADKGLQVLHGKRLVDHVYERLAPQVAGVLVNANANHDAYKSFGVRVISDAITDEGGAGPLAGLHAGLVVSKRPFLVTVPCDSPFFPTDLVARLMAALEERGAHLAVAKTGDQAHPVFTLVRRTVLDGLTTYLKGGGRKIDAWYAQLEVVEVPFDDEQSFANINTPEDLEAAEQGLPIPIEKRAPGQKKHRKASVETRSGIASSSIDTPNSAPVKSLHDSAFEFLTVPTATTPSSLTDLVSCIDGYDPNALPVAQVNEVIRQFVQPIKGHERVAVRAALGRVLAEDIISPINVPAHDNSAMDGYAVRGSDVKDGPATLTCVGTAFAGKEFGGKVAPGECVRVMTGAVMPAHCDTVVVQEIVQVNGEQITVPTAQEPGQNRRFAGEDLRKGASALRAGKLIGPAELGLIASLGQAEVSVRRKLRVAFFSTGDELRSLGEPLGTGEVYDSNRYTLYGMLTRLGCDVLDVGVVPDQPAALEAAFRSASANADAIITSGGVSVGEADFTKQMMKQLGDVLFWKIAMRPGRPMAFGRIGTQAEEAHQAYLFGLPGNPVAVMVTFYHFVRAALLHMAGRNDIELPLMTAISAEAMRKKPGRTEYQRGIVEWQEGRLMARTTGQQGSGVLRSMSEANCFIVLEHDQGSVKAGDLVKVMLFEGLV